jgi:MFS family permease
MRLQGGGVNTADAVRAVLASKRDRRIIITALGVTQIFAWGSSYYLPAVLAKPIATETGWPFTWVIGGLSLGLLLAGLISPVVGRTIERLGGRSVLAASAVLLAAGLLVLALAQSLAVYLGAWIVIGLGMGAGLSTAPG